MLALLSSPVRRFLLITLLVPAIAFVLLRLGRFLQRRNDGQPTRTSRVLVSSGSFLRRRVGRGKDDADPSKGSSSAPAALNGQA